MAGRKIIYKGSRKSAIEREEVRDFSERRSSFVRSAQYRKAFLCAKEAFQRFPKNRFAQYNFAVSLGDCEEWAPAKQQERNRRKSVSILRGLLRRTRGIDPLWVRVWQNEFYWFSRQPHKQYLLGVRGVRGGDRYAYYSMGVGATAMALSVFYRSPLAAARWADKSIAAWKHYFKIVPDYYNAYVWYAKALGLSGDMAAMDRALKKASKLSGRPLNYQEFADARKEVLSALAKSQKKSKRK